MKRRALTCGLLLSAFAASCAQTDQVATLSKQCPPAGDCAEPDGCLPQLCPSLAGRELLCASESLPVLAGDGCSALPERTASSRFAVCSCSDFVSAGSVTIDAYSGAPGTAAPGRAALGVNRALSLPAATRIDGPVLVVGESSLAPDISPSIVPTRVATAPCGCAPEQLLDVTGAVVARRLDNDNGTLPANELDGFTGPREIDLECGRYYLTRIAGDAKLTIRTRGNTALYVAGDIEIDDALELQSVDGSPISLFVAGELRVRGSFSLGGDPGGAGRAGLFADSRGTLGFGGSTAIVGNLYAPHAELVNGGPLELYGSLLVRRVAPTSDLVVHYDVAAAEPASCR